MTSEPVLLEPLADRSMGVAAIALRLAAVPASTISALAESALLRSLAAAIPCIIDKETAGTLPADTDDLLVVAGCRVVETSAIATIDDLAGAALPESVQWLAGRWYLTPEQKAPDARAASRSLELKLLQLVANDADTREIEAVFRQDPVLSYHLLRLVNSIGVGTSRHISSFSQAILILGRQQLKRWLNLMLFSANSNSQHSAMLLAHVAVRSRSMELLAKACGQDRPAQEQAFMIGMFSMLDILFGMPLQNVLPPLNLGRPMASALLSEEGELGRILQTIRLAECFDTAGLKENLTALGVSGSDYTAITLEAYQWMLGVIRDQSGKSDAE